MRRNLHQEPCLYKGSACAVRARYPLNQFAARAGQHRHRQAQAPPRRSFTNRCLPAPHFGAQPSCRPPAPAAPPAAGEIAAAQKPPHGKHLPHHKGQRQGSPGAAGGTRSVSPRERPPGAGTAAAPAGNGHPIPPRWRPDRRHLPGSDPRLPPPFPGARAAPAAGGEGRDGTGRRREKRQDAGGGAAVSRHLAGPRPHPSLTCGPRVAARSPRLRHLPGRCRRRVPPGPAGLAAPAAAAQAQCPPRHLTARGGSRAEARGGPRPGRRGGPGAQVRPRPALSAPTPAGPRSGRGAAERRFGGRARSVGLSPRAEQRAPAGLPGGSCCFSRIFPSRCLRALFAAMCGLG